tara:strand:+ start:99 stop:491 length:393 start_codon:yes stop_codon:yes gene_type:complete
MLRGAPLVLLASLLAGCVSHADRPHALTVDEVFDRIFELDGQRIQVVGFVSECDRFNCAIFSRVASPRRSLPIASSSNFDKSVMGFNNREAIIEATLDIRCLGIRREGRPLMPCTDRADVLKDATLVSAQ